MVTLKYLGSIIDSAERCLKYVDTCIAEVATMLQAFQRLCRDIVTSSLKQSCGCIKYLLYRSEICVLRKAEEHQIVAFSSHFLGIFCHFPPSILSGRT